MEKRKVGIIVLWVIVGAVFLTGYFLLKKSIADEQLCDYLTDSLLRAFLSLALLSVTKKLGYKTTGFKGMSLFSLIVVLPVLVVSVNNFPFVEFSAGRTTLVRGELVLPFALNCITTAMFEELIFRALFFPWCLEAVGCDSLSKTFKALLISSAVFGAMHLFNLATSSPFAVIMQVGYTFLFGGAMCYVMLETRCVWICVFLHAVYNFGGLLYAELGEGFLWSFGQILLTALVAVSCALVIFVVFFKRKEPYKTFLENNH